MLSQTLNICKKFYDTNRFFSCYEVPYCVAHACSAYKPSVCSATDPWLIHALQTSTVWYQLTGDFLRPSCERQSNATPPRFMSEPSCRMFVSSISWNKHVKLIARFSALLQGRSGHNRFVPTFSQAVYGMKCQHKHNVVVKSYRNLPQVLNMYHPPWRHKAYGHNNSQTVNLCTK